MEFTINDKYLHCYQLFTCSNSQIKRGKEKLQYKTDIKHPVELGRPKGWEFCLSENKLKFPKAIYLNQKEPLAIALHSFANHELLAMELFAWAILTFHDYPFLHGIWYQTLLEEQSHFNLYIDRIEQLGFSFGDFPLNSFFFRTVTKSNSPQEFISLMNLSFEQANLDHALYYRDIFAKFGDNESAQIMQTILEDEILHIKRSIPFMQKKSSEEHQDFWAYYLNNLKKTNITPARAKGIHFNYSARVDANLPSDFIQNVKEYNDNFASTSRKEWKQ